MSTDTLDVYLPMDRRQALAKGEDLPDRTYGAALFADISGFTPLTAALAEELGPQRGAEELIRQLNQVYDALITELHRYGGSVIAFSGDAITCWLDQDDGPRSAACGLAMQDVMVQFAEVRTLAGTTVSLGVKVAVVAGPARRFLVGDPQIQRLEAVAGATMDRMAAAENQAERGEVIVGQEVVARLGDRAWVQEWRESPGGDRFAIVARLGEPVAPAPWPEVASIPEEVAGAWVFAPVCRRLREGESGFLAELRPTVALFIKFTGIDYDGDDDAEAKLDAYVAWVQKVVTGYEGYLVDLTVGDKGSYLYANFGAPVAHEDDPARAVAAALALQAPPAEVGFVQDVQMGISRGRMRAGAVGGPGRRTYAVMGNEVNVAARLMGKAGPGQVFVSPRVARDAGRFEFRELEAIPLKGLPEPMPVFVPLGVMSEAVAGTLKGRALTPMIGRVAEREALAERLQALREGQPGGIVIIEGEAGIGKSRLAADLVDRAQAAGVTALLGAGQSIEQQTPYRAWRDVLAAYFRLGEEADPVGRQGRVRDAVRSITPDHVQRLPLLNDILNLGLTETELTASLSPELRQQSLFLLLVSLIQGRAREQPLVLLLEDAHWLDSLSWELALYVARAMAISGEPFLLVMVTRPPEENTPAARHTATLQVTERAETLALDSLSPEETVTLVTVRLGLQTGNLPDVVAGLVRERAGGNPFFAEELVLALRDQDLIRVEVQDGETRCLVSDALDEAVRDLPDSVQGVVLSRIDRLPPEQQLTLKIASVIGRTFLYRTLDYIVDQNTAIAAAVLKDHLDGLAALDLTPVEAPEPDLAYIFRHITTQEVAYQTLLFAQRGQLHRTVARWYEVTYGGTEEQLAPHLPLLVHHYHYAEDTGQERHYAKLAGNQAAAQYANLEAVRYLSRALELTDEDDLAERYDLVLAREKVNDLQGEREAQQQDLPTLENLAETLADERRQAEVALRRANYAERTGDYPATIAASQATISLARAVQDVRSEAMGFFWWGAALWYQGKYEASQTQLKHALDLARAADLPHVEADSLRNLGIVASYLGDYPGSMSHFEQALHIYCEIGDRVGEGKSLNWLGNTLADQGNHVEARDHYVQALHIYREIGDRRGESIALTNLGVTSMEQGDYTGATVYCEQALRLYREIGDRQGECWTLNNLGLASFHQSNYIQANESFSRALQVGHEIGDTQTGGSALSNLGLVSSSLGNDEAAREYSERALHVAQEVGDRSTEAEALTHLGHSLAGLGRLEEAAEAYRWGLAIRRELGEQNLAIESLAGLARVSMAQGDSDLALSQVEEILAHLETRSLDGTYEPVRIYLTCYRTLKARADPRAREVLTAAHNLLQERVARIEDEAMKRSFLENVAAHSEIVRAWETG